jgi:hypothetical protein
MITTVGRDEPYLSPRPARFYWSRRKVYVILAGLLVVLGVGGLIIAYGDQGARVIGSAWVAGFAWLAALLWRRSRSTDPVVIVDAAGLSDSRILYRPILWRDIARLETLKIEELAFVGVVLRDEAAYLNDVRWMVRATRWANRLFRFPLITISMHTLDGSNDDLIAAIATYRPDLAAPGS